MANILEGVDWNGAANNALSGALAGFSASFAPPNPMPVPTQTTAGAGNVVGTAVSSPSFDPKPWLIGAAVIAVVIAAVVLAKK